MNTMKELLKNKIPPPPGEEVDEQRRSTIDTEKSLAEKMRDMTVFYYKVLSKLSGAFCDVVEENTKLKAEMEGLKIKYENVKKDAGILVVGEDD